MILDFVHDNKNFNENGISIKSYLGNKPTLLNASGSNTNFVYEVTNFNDQLLDEINSINSKFKIKDRTRAIYDNGSSLIFKSLETETFQYNLKLIDSDMPYILSQMIIEFYKIEKIN